MTLEERAAIVGREARKKCVFCEEPVRAVALEQLVAAVADEREVVADQFGYYLEDGDGKVLASFVSEDDMALFVKVKTGGYRQEVLAQERAQALLRAARDQKEGGS